MRKAKTKATILPPDDLSEAELAVWAEIEPLIYPADRFAAANFCRVHASLLECRGAIAAGRRDGIFAQILTAKNGSPAINPLLKRESALIAQEGRLLRDLRLDGLDSPWG